MGWQLDAGVDSAADFAGILSLAPVLHLERTKPLTHERAFESLASSNLPHDMANTKSAIKAARKSVRLTERNRGVKTRLKTLRKRLDALLTAKDAEASKTAAAEYVSAMDKAVKSGVVHKNAASRAKSHAAKVFSAK